jgi:hypothetical protein
VLGCVAAGWWQLARAVGGNPLSYVYVVEWPVFAAAGIFGWWALLHSAPSTDEERAARRAYEDAQRGRAQQAKRRPEQEDQALAAYNDHLAALSGLEPGPAKAPTEEGTRP